MEVKIVREPKGGPDIIFIGTQDIERRLLLAGDHLSVRGFTARVVTLPEGMDRLSQLADNERTRALAGGAPHLCINTDPILAEASAAQIASAALEVMQL